MSRLILASEECHVKGMQDTPIRDMHMEIPHLEAGRYILLSQINW